MKNHKLEPLTEIEKSFAEKNHNLIYKYLRKYAHSMEESYNIAVFGYLKAVQIYHRREDLREKYDFAFIAWQYMRAELKDSVRAGQAKKRGQAENTVSLDAEYAENENLYNTIIGKSAESVVMEVETIRDIMENLSMTQRKIARLKLEGYTNKDVFVMLEIPQSTFYKELERIKSAMEKTIIRW